MTDRLDDLTAALTDLIGVRDRIKQRTDLTDEDRASILGPLGDAISDCEYMMRAAYEDQPRDRHAHMGGAS